MSMSAKAINNNVPILNVSATQEGFGSNPSPNSFQPRSQGPRQNAPLEYPSLAPRPTKPTEVFRQTFQTGFLSILYAIGQHPLELWEKQVRSGYIKRITDNDINSLALEILSPNIDSTFITTPASPLQSLGIRLPIIVLILKNLKRYFMYEIQVLDNTNAKRRFVVGNYQATAKLRPFKAHIPLKLDDGWNQVSFNLAEMTKKIYNTEYKETVRLQIHANCRLRRVYFCDRVYGEEEVPTDFKLFIMSTAQKEKEGENKGSISNVTNETSGPDMMLMTPSPNSSVATTRTKSSKK